MNLVKQCPNCSTMLRFPATQGTILVQCPVCSHRFTFVPDLESPEDFSTSEPIPSFQFKPSFQSYKDLIIDLLYAPIDYLKSKQVSQKKEFRLIPILLFAILLLYFWKWSSVTETQKPDSVIDEQFQNPNMELNPEPEDPREESQPETKPSFEI
ncbi:zinc-ribbon domain-containing protein [Leptospira meyeri]|nr:zinc-ribbon domain-containing protein [Leptospira meyeri]